jgi:hypothetical protein
MTLAMYASHAGIAYLFQKKDMNVCVASCPPFHQTFIYYQDFATNNFSKTKF